MQTLQTWILDLTSLLVLACGAMALWMAIFSKKGIFSDKPVSEFLLKLFFGSVFVVGLAVDLRNGGTQINRLFTKIMDFIMLQELSILGGIATFMVSVTLIIFVIKAIQTGLEPKKVGVLAIAVFLIVVLVTDVQGDRRLVDAFTNVLLFLAPGSSSQ